MIDDDELYQIFIEEAKDILENLYKLLEEWKNTPGNKEIPMAILRELHTLKGSARMIGLVELNEYAHQLEQVVQQTQHSPKQPYDKSFINLQHALDHINANIEELVKHKVSEVDPNQKEPHLPLKIAIPARVNKISSKSGDVIRVKSSLLEKFSMWAAHVNVARSNVEQQLHAAREALVENVKQIKLIQEQMRVLQLKTDTSISVKQVNFSEKKYDEFDVLEMDRYTFLQQSTRLLEDKLKIVEGLNSKIVHSIRQAETMLHEQKRAVRSLEEGIIHTRLISIDYLVPRLNRVVRQVSEELNKKVDLECLKVEGEIDRKILERLISPLEHMIRNAIAHGIEVSEVRKIRGKPEKGYITLLMLRQGNEILIQLADDGQGIDIEKVQKKAIEKNLWPPQAIMSQMDAIQMIFLPGFSTKDTITPISGQGLGMDVVNTEVNKLGGLLRIDTIQNVGTKFTIRLPFKLSLNQALVFKVGKQRYALQLSALAGLTRLSLNEIEELLSQTPAKIYYNQKNYRLYYLSQLLGIEGVLNKSKMQAVPVIFLLAEHNPIAIVVDKLIGSSEMVIKPPGAQLQFVAEISGISQMGDDIVLMLDSPSLIACADKLVTGQVKEIATINHLEEQELNHKMTVVIVDDSITVRNVTSRLLKRHNYITMQAKDGIEALQLINENRPEIVLLDIEMPKMDGFSVLEKLRANDEFKELPVIMITSRAGEKHRLHATSLGASGYLTKPYLEEELLFILRKIEHSKYRK